jgi:Xaa-Pro dipeptidase
VPKLLREGMSEAELGCELFSFMVREGHQGLVRFGMFGAECLLGQFTFGESSLCPVSMDTPSGWVGLEPAAPVFGSRERTLRKGDMVCLDVGCGVGGYHTDKTMTYAFGGMPSPEAVTAQRRCEAIQDESAAMLKPGAVPSEIYTTIMKSLDPTFLKDFMGFNGRRANFLGHGIGLLVDEPPAIAERFEEPLGDGMVIALEPKKGLPGVGMVGIENTFVVTPDGGKSLTGTSPGLIPVG